MKITEMRALTVDELEAQLEKARKELFDDRFKHSLRQLENTSELRLIKHRIAQLQTVLREKQLQPAGGQTK